jgi:hypothetical protein
MGSSSLLGIITRRLLFTSTQLAYEGKLRESLFEISDLVTKESITPKQLKKFCEIFDLRVCDNGQIEIRTLDHHNALWNRAHYGIATCSNHLERLHRTLNEAVSGLKLITRRFSVVTHIILDWPKTFSQNQHRQEKLIIKTLRNRAAEDSILQTDQCNSPKCGWSAFYSRLFGINDFPCIHTVTLKSPQFLEIPFPDFNVLGNELVFKEEQIQTNVSTKRIPYSRGEQNETDEKVNDSQSDIAFITETAAELMKYKPTEFKQRTFSLIYVTQAWTMFTEGEKPIRSYSDDENLEIDEIITSEFWVELFSEISE